jgi:hypothetical protein
MDLPLFINVMTRDGHLSTITKDLARKPISAMGGICQPVKRHIPLRRCDLTNQDTVRCPRLSAWITMAGLGFR